MRRTVAAVGIGVIAALVAVGCTARVTDEHARNACDDVDEFLEAYGWYEDSGGAERDDDEYSDVPTLDEIYAEAQKAETKSIVEASEELEGMSGGPVGMTSEVALDAVYSFQYACDKLTE